LFPHRAETSFPAEKRPVFCREIRKHRWVYLCLFGAWFFLASLVAAFSITNDLRSAKLRFSEYANTLYSDIYNRVQANEAVLEGIAAFLSTSGAIDDGARISRYAQQVQTRYPHIYMIEVAERVARQNLPDLIARKKSSGFPDFRVGAFSHESSRTWQPIVGKPWYYPIVFMEPMPAQARNILGMDMDSTPILRQAMNQSNRQGRAVSSHPFRLVEGDLAYLIFRPVEQASGAKKKPVNPEHLLAALVIKTQAILPPAQPGMPGIGYSLYHSDFPAHRPEGELVHIELPARSALETFLLPKLNYTNKLPSEIQPFTLQVDRQLGWPDLDLRLLSAILAITVLSFGILLKFVIAHRRSEIERCLTEGRFAYQANHDALTGLANRTLFTDRLTHAMARAHRCNSRLALLFLDLDEFKREDDTVARLSGDEFIVILESITTHQGAETAAEVISDSLALPFQIGGETLNIGVSIGISIYPDDSTDIDELIKIADHAMYEVKGKGPISPTRIEE
jgi:GGDEF domain-containing protein